MAKKQRPYPTTSCCWNPWLSYLYLYGQNRNTDYQQDDRWSWVDRGKTYDNEQLGNLKDVAEANWLLIVAAINNDVSINEANEMIGDPTEIALYDFAQINGFIKGDLLKTYPEVKHFPFEAERKSMTTEHQLPNNEGFVSFTKGAIDVMLTKAGNLSATEKEQLEQAVNQLSSDGYRVIGFSMKNLKAVGRTKGRRFGARSYAIGCFGDDGPYTARSCRCRCDVQWGAGIKTVMITGDHPEPPNTIARQLGILQADEGLVMTGTDLMSLSAEELADKVGNKYGFMHEYRPNKNLISSKHCKAKGRWWLWPEMG